MDRRKTLLSMFDATGLGLEIGASYNPLLPKAQGYRVETLDHATQAELQSKYRDNPGADADAIEPVDHVSDGRLMVEVIGRDKTYDFIVASHVIEHAPDILGFLKDCEALLKPGGVLVLAVPDMRYCFDRFRPRSSLGAVIDAHREGRRRHTRASLIDRIAYNSRLDDRPGWSRTCTGTQRLQFDLETVPAIAAKYESGAYVDTHGWQFTPSSFRGLVEDLFSLGMIGLREERFVETPIFEFFTILSREGQGPGLSRLELLEAVLDEEAESAALFRRTVAERDLLKTADAGLQEQYRRASAAMQTTKKAAESESLPCEIQQWKAQAQQLERERQAFLRSRSWRLTAPLRAVTRAFKTRQ